MEPNRTLMDPQKKHRVSIKSALAIRVSARIAEIEQTPDMQRRAARIFCRALIRLYIQENGDAAIGNGLGVL
jgi:hypothetical protein